MTGTPEAAEYGRAVRIAGLKAAVYLAEVTKALEADRLEVCKLEGEAKTGLPGVAYLFQASMPYVYGESLAGGAGVGGPGPLPTLIHPNEILDGALVNAFAWAGCAREATYILQNHAVIKGLYSHQGKDLDFRGVVLYTFGENIKTKERISSHASNLAILLGAEGAILNYLGGGHPIVDVMLTCQKLEGRGLKTTLLLMEMAANPEDSGHVHFVREAKAIVSTGNYEQRIDLAPMPKVLGGSRILESGEEASGPLSLTLRHVLGSTDQFGSMTLRGRDY
jgi:glycine reductase